MKLVRSRLVAGALGLAVAGTATGGVIAQRGRLGAAGAGRAAGRRLDHARLRRDHRQARRCRHRSRSRTPPRTRCGSRSPCARGSRTAPPARSSLNTRASLSPYVRAARRRSTSSRASARVKLNMRRMTASGSLYGGFQVFAKQAKPKATNGIIPQWDLRGKLRLNPSRKRPNLRVGATDVVGRGNNRSLILAVRNIGNTLDPVGGTVRITGPTARNATIPQVGVVPGQVVYLKGGALRGMKGRQLHRHVDGHAGRQALHRQAHLQALRTRSWTRLHPCTRSSPRSWRRSGGAPRPPCATCRRRSTRAADKIRAYTTLLTVMTRLDGKGLLVRRRAGRLDVYAPALVARRVPRRRAPRPRSPRSSRTSAISRSRTSRVTSGARPAAAGDAPPAGRR